MRRALARSLVAVLALAAIPAAARAQSRDDARPRDLQRLQEDLANLDEALAGLEAGDSKTESFRARAEEIREETIYLKVKMRRHRQAGRDGTGVSSDETEDLRRAIRDLREDIESAYGRGGSRDVRIPEGTALSIRLDEPISSRNARREDRFDASVFRPVRAEGRLAIPAGTQVRGIVRDVEPAQRGTRAGRVELDFDAIFFEKERLDLRTKVISIADDDRDEKAEKAGIGAVLGGVVGGILGGKRGAIVGAVLGGTGAVVASKGEEVDLPAGTIVRVRLERPLLIPRR